MERLRTGSDPRAARRATAAAAAAAAADRWGMPRGGIAGQVGPHRHPDQDTRDTLGDNRGMPGLRPVGGRYPWGRGGAECCCRSRRCVPVPFTLHGGARSASCAASAAACCERGHCAVRVTVRKSGMCPLPVHGGRPAPPRLGAAVPLSRPRLACACADQREFVCRLWRRGAAAAFLPPADALELLLTPVRA